MNVEEVFLSAAQYARLRGVAETYIHQLRRNCRLVLNGRGEIAMHASDQLIASTRLRQPRRGTAGAVPGHPWAAKRAQVPARSAADRVDHIVVEALLHAANTLAPRVTGITDVAACRAFLAQELARAAKKISRSISRHEHVACEADAGSQGHVDD